MPPAARWPSLLDLCWLSMFGSCRCAWCLCLKAIETAGDGQHAVLRTWARSAGGARYGKAEGVILGMERDRLAGPSEPNRPAHGEKRVQRSLGHVASGQVWTCGAAGLPV
ncbi:hypothetical protein BC567DRAFT_54088 [Phyllosticta citribraziliensis]